MSAPPPAAAVVVPARDAAPWIGAAIASVLAQTEPRLELVVVDDGSTDGTAEVVAAAARRDERVRLLAAAGRGPGAARNQGVAATQAPFLCFLDADDELAPEALERRIAVLEGAPEAALAYGDTRLVAEPGGAEVRVHRPDRDGAVMAAQLRLGEPCFHLHSVLVRRTWFERVGGFPAGLDQLEDVVLWTRIALAGGRFVHADAPPDTYLLHAGSRSHDPLLATEGRVRLLRLLLASGITPDERRHVTGRLRERLLLLAGVRVARGDRSGARRDALRSLRLARRPGHVRESVACALDPGRAARFVAHLPDHIRAGI